MNVRHVRFSALGFWQLATMFALALMAAVTMAGSASAQSVAWAKQIGTSNHDNFWDVAADNAGNLFAVGETGGTIFAPSQGSTDAIMARFDSNGNLVGGLQDGTAAGDELIAVAVDGAGGVFAAGNTQGGGSLGPPAVGTGDIIVGRINAANAWTWLQQDPVRDAFGGGGEPTGNFITAGTAFSSVAGPHLGGGDAFVQVFDATGAVLWDDQIGTTAHEGAFTATADVFGDYYIAGRTEGSWAATQAGMGDMFVAKYDSLGTQQWVRQLGSAGNDSGTSVAVDFSGNVYVAGITDGDLGGTNLGSFDNFLAKYDSAGNFQWVEHIASAGLESNPDIETLGASVWLTGWTTGSVYATNAGLSDVHVARFDPAGNVTWSAQLGTAAHETAESIAADLGRVYIAGTSTGIYGGPHQGGDDALLIAINALPPIPEPSSLALLLCGSMTAAAIGRRLSCQSVKDLRPPKIYR